MSASAFVRGVSIQNFFSARQIMNKVNFNLPRNPWIDYKFSSLKVLWGLSEYADIDDVL